VVWKAWSLISTVWSPLKLQRWGETTRGSVWALTNKPRGKGFVPGPAVQTKSRFRAWVYARFCEDCSGPREGMHPWCLQSPRLHASLCFHGAALLQLPWVWTPGILSEGLIMSSLAPESAGTTHWRWWHCSPCESRARLAIKSFSESWPLEVPPRCRAGEGAPRVRIRAGKETEE